LGSFRSIDDELLARLGAAPNRKNASLLLALGKSHAPSAPNLGVSGGCTQSKKSATIVSLWYALARTLTAGTCTEGEPDNGLERGAKIKPERFDELSKRYTGGTRVGLVTVEARDCGDPLGLSRSSASDGTVPRQESWVRESAGKSTAEAGSTGSASGRGLNRVESLSREVNLPARSRW
jgi:hypothetical protein